MTPPAPPLQPAVPGSPAEPRVPALPVVNDPEGRSLGSAEAISGDGRAIVGSRTNPAGESEAYLVIVPEPSAGVLLSASAVIAVRRPRRAANHRPRS